jgi:hypothetical protein
MSHSEIRLTMLTAFAVSCFMLLGFVNNSAVPEPTNNPITLAPTTDAPTTKNLVTITTKKPWNPKTACKCKQSERTEVCAKMAQDRYYKGAPAPYCYTYKVFWTYCEIWTEKGYKTFRTCCFGNGNHAYVGKVPHECIWY